MPFDTFSLITLKGVMSFAKLLFRAFCYKKDDQGVIWSIKETIHGST